MRRTRFLHALGGATIAAASALSAVPVRAAGGRPILVAEPFHNLGYLPLYVAMKNGYFSALDVSLVSMPMSASAHADAVLTGKAWAFIGGPEHNAFADVKGANLRAVVNIVNRGNVYFVVRKGLTPGRDARAFIKGRTIVTTPYGGTPNSITRYLCQKIGVDVKKDVTLLEVTNAAIPAVVSQGKADLACVSEPMLSKGIQDGIWEQPFFNVPKALGPYAYSTINVPLDTVTHDAATTRAFVAGMLKGLAFVRDHRDAATAIAAREFPDLTPPILNAAMQRSYDDQLWEWSGGITPQSIRTAEAVVKAAGLLTTDVAYGDVVDVRYLDTKPGSKG